MTNEQLAEMFQSSIGKLVERIAEDRVSVTDLRRNVTDLREAVAVIRSKLENGIMTKATHKEIEKHFERQIEQARKEAADAKEYAGAISRRMWQIIVGLLLTFTGSVGSLVVTLVK